MQARCRWILLWTVLLTAVCPQPFAAHGAGEAPSGATPFKVGIVPIRDDINTPMVFLVRRGVKEAMKAEADMLVIDMDTNGGRVDKTQEIIEIIGQFPGVTVTFVNRKAFSAGAFIAFGTQRIYMAPEAVIGAAAPVMVSPGGGTEKLNETMEAKMNSAVAAMVRASAEKNGHNVDVADAMVRRTKELVIDGETLNKQGEILTLTSKAAGKLYGNPPKPLLSMGTHDTLDSLLHALGRGEARRIVIEPTGWEAVGSFLSSQIVSSLLLIIGLAGIYIEFKTPGFGLPGIVGIVSLGVYFLGGYIAGLSGAGWIVLFFAGVALVALELFVFPGTLVAGLLGIASMMVAIVMSLVDLYPTPGNWVPSVPGAGAFAQPLQTLATAVAGTLVAIVALGRFLPKTSFHRGLVTQTVSGARSDAALVEAENRLLGAEGFTVSALRPSGRARFGEQMMDVVSQGEMIDAGRPVKIIRFSGAQPVVQVI